MYAEKQLLRVILFLLSKTFFLFSRKPFCPIRMSVWTSWPTTGSLFAISDICAESLNMLCSCFWFLHNSNPTNPFITRNRRESFPFLDKIFIASQDFLYIIRYIMDDAAQKCDFRHTYLL